MCSVRLFQINNIIDKAKHNLISTINTVYNPLSSSQQTALDSILNYRTWWLPIYEPIHITFVDMIKGIVPRKLISKINEITSSNAASHEIVGILFDFIHLSATKF